MGMICSFANTKDVEETFLGVCMVALNEVNRVASLTGSYSQPSRFQRSDVQVRISVSPCAPSSKAFMGSGDQALRKIAIFDTSPGQHSLARGVLGLLDAGITPARLCDIEMIRVHRIAPLILGSVPCGIGTISASTWIKDLKETHSILAEVGTRGPAVVPNRSAIASEPVSGADPLGIGASWIDCA